MRNMSIEPRKIILST